VDDSERRELTQSMHRSAGSFELVASPVLLGLLGFWLDRTFTTTPYLTIVFCVLAVVGAATKIYIGYDREMSVHDEGKPWATRS
jgi:F0F1-type ATP synthase assembly protein I